MLRVAPDSPAERADVQPGNVIVALDETLVTSVEEIQHMLARVPVGTMMRIGVLWGAALRELVAILATHPED